MRNNSVLKYNAKPDFRNIEFVFLTRNNKMFVPDTKTNILISGPLFFEEQSLLRKCVTDLYTYVVINAIFCESLSTGVLNPFHRSSFERTPDTGTSDFYTECYWDRFTLANAWFPIESGRPFLTFRCVILCVCVCVCVYPI